MDVPSQALPSGEALPPGGGGGGDHSNSKPLNPNAKEWLPETNGAPEEDRCLFITFSNGNPIPGPQIVRFFTLKYGDCSDRVYVHWPTLRDFEETNITTPQSGKVVFKTSWIPSVIIECGKRETKFIVDGRRLCCKKFDITKTRASKWKFFYVKHSSYFILNVSY